ncbi:MAG: T4 family baseplate hub assembly chaperone [Methylophagaceae bacterium]
MENKNTNPLQKYFRQPKIYLSLPSNGKYYPAGSLEISENGEYPVFPMTARDEIMIKTPDALLNGQATASVITSCIPAIKDPFNMPSMDLDACLIAIRIATYGEMMEVSIKVPVTGEDKDFDLDLRIMLDQFSNVDYNSAIQLDGMIVNLRPLTYGEFTETSRQTFDEQRIFKVLNDTDMAEGDKLATFTESFKKLTDLTILTLEKSIASIEVGDDVVTDQAHIKEFIANTDKGLFESVTNHIEEQRTKFQVKPLVVDATPEEIEAGVPETYEVPVTFDQSSFFV